MNNEIDFNISDNYGFDIINGKKWFICKYNDCEKTELNEQSIVSHIKLHFNQQSKANNYFNNNNNYNNENKIWTKDSFHPIRKVSKKCHKINNKLKIIDKINNNNNKNLLKCESIGCGQIFFYNKSFINHKDQHLFDIKIKAENKIENKSNSFESGINEKIVRQKRDLRFDSNYRGLQSLKNVEQYFELKVINDIKQYFCKYKINCNFKTKLTQHMARHIHLSHIQITKFKCNQINCNKVFKSPATLRQHELNHLCGFEIINGKNLNTICGNKSINRYRNRVLINDKKFFECLWNGCEFKTNSHYSIKSHIHNQHLCPNRVKQNGIIIRSIDQKPQINETNDEVIDRKPQNYEITEKSLVYKKYNSVYTKTTYESALKQIEILTKIKSYFEIKIIDNEFSYCCKHNECKFKAKTLELIAIHLKLKHFISY
jgi:hypothetical protein